MLAQITYVQMQKTGKVINHRTLRLILDLVWQKLNVGRDDQLRGTFKLRFKKKASNAQSVRGILFRKFNEQSDQILLRCHNFVSRHSIRRIPPDCNKNLIETSKRRRGHVIKFS